MLLLRKETFVIGFCIGIRIHIISKSKTKILKHVVLLYTKISGSL